MIILGYLSLHSLSVLELTLQLKMTSNSEILLPLPSEC